MGSFAGEGGGQCHTKCRHFYEHFCVQILYHYTQFVTRGYPIQCH